VEDLRYNEHGRGFSSERGGIAPAGAGSQSCAENSHSDHKFAALVDERRTAPRDIYDLELLLARGACPSRATVDNLGGQAALVKRVSDKLDLMGWALFRDEVLPTLPMEMRANIDEDEYLAMKVRLLETLERCLLKPVTEEGAP
jgi:hypothetical protein